MAHILTAAESTRSFKDPFWDLASELLLEALIAYCYEAADKKDRTLKNVLELCDLATCSVSEESDSGPLDILMKKLKADNPESYAWRQYNK